MYTCQSPCVSIPPLSATLHPVSSFYLDHRRRSSVSRSPPSRPSNSLPLARSCSRHIYLLSTPLRLSRHYSLFPLSTSALCLALSFAFNPSAHIRTSWGGVVHHAVRPVPLSPQLSPSPSEPPVRLLALRHPSSSRGYSASQHRRRRENRYYGEINMIGRRMPRYPYT